MSAWVLEISIPPTSYNQTIMIDLHCHLLPDIDDGPPHWEGTLSLARQLVQEGVWAAAATPHSYSSGGREKDRVLNLTREANQLFTDQDVPLTALPGMEVILTELTVSQLKTGQILPLGASRTVLLETSAYVEFEDLESAVRKIQALGFKVLLAHPEKIETLYDYPNLLVPLVQDGLVTQITAGNLTGLGGERKRRMCEKLLTHGLTHVVASDAHAASGPRRPALREGLAAAEGLLGSRAVHLFTTIPQMILNDDLLPGFNPKPISR